jgi:flavin reductase (DIM6/NTAB) family NADH-FMN oxidoreductase RutF
VTTAARSRVADCADEMTGLSAAGFAEAFGNLAAGVALVTADSPGGPVVAATSNVMPISTVPALFAIGLPRSGSGTDGISRSESIVLHLLTADQLELARRCQNRADASEFSWGWLSTGEPRVFGAAVWIRGEIVDRVDAGDSVLVIAHATHACYPPVGMTRDPSWPGPLVRHRDEWHRLGAPSRLP